MIISVILQALTGNFVTDTKRAAKAAEKSAKDIEKAYAKMGADIGKKIAAVVGPAGIGLLIKRSIDAAAELDDLAQKTGVSVEALSRLQYAAGLEGVDDLAGSLQKLAKNIAENGDTFAALGINVKNAAGELRTTEDVIGDIAEVFSKSADGTRKAAIAQELFGKTGAQLIPLLNKGKTGLNELYKEADRLGITISSNTSKAADDFNNNLFRLTSTVKGAVNQITAGLLPSLNRITDAMVSGTGGTSAFEVAGRALGVVFETITVLGANVAYVFEGVGREIGGIAAQLAAIATGDFARAGFIRDEMIADAQRARKEIDALSESILNSKKAGEAGPEPGKGQLPDIEAMKKAAEEAAKARKKASDDAQKDAEKALKGALDAEEKQRESISAVIDGLREESLAMSMNTAQQAARKIEILGGTDAERDQAYQLAQYIELQKKAAQEDEDRAAVLKETRTYAEVYADEIQRLNRLFDNGTKDSAIYRRAVEQAQDAFDKAEKAAEEASNGMAVFTDQAARNMQDAFADFLFDPFDQGVKGMVRSFAQALQRMAAEALAAGIFQKLTAGAGGSGGLFNSLFGFGASFFSGGVSSSGTYSAANIAGRASGGPVTGGTPYIVGEQGPELFVPDTTGSIVPNMRMNEMGKTTVNLRNINAFDTSAIGDYMNSAAGEEVFLNLVSRNGAKIRNQITNG